MAKIIEELQARVTDAQRQLAESAQVFQVAQQKHQAAQHNFNVWNMALQVEQRDEQLRQAKATEKQLHFPTANPKAEAMPAATVAAAPEQPPDNPEALNKTDSVRNLLRQHPTGMSAVDIWKEVGAQFIHRPYLYSVLKRLRDRDEIIKRRNKYCLTAIPKSEEVKEQPVVH
jgi:hypothetical protein